MREKEMISYVVFDHLSIGPLNLYTWGLFVGLAFAVGYLMVLYRARRANIKTGKIIGLVLSIFIGAGLGSRLLFLLQEPQKFFNDISLLWHIDQGGLMLYGGVLGGILGGWLYIKMAPSPLQGEGWGEVNLFWKIADLAAPAIALGIIIGRLGCFLINDHAGSPTNLPWGILWPDGIVRHPVALYESLAAFALFCFLLWREKRIRSLISPPSSVEEGAGGGGVLSKNQLLTSILPSSEGRRNFQIPQFLLFIILYAAIRFFLDFLRESQGILADPRWWGLTSSQWIAIGLIIFTFLLLNKKRDPETSSG